MPNAMYLQRKIFSSLEDHIEKKQVTVIIGMRRTGKTTLVKELLSHVKSENKLFIDLERMDNRFLFTEKNYDNITNSLEQRGLNFNQKAFLALDEIQIVPEIVSVIKYLYDKYTIKFILTGSSSFYLKNLFSESLSGRKKIFELYTLNFSELLTFNDVSFKENVFYKKNFNPAEYERLKFYYEQYIIFGGFPEVVLSKKTEDKKDLLNDIISSYINVDIKTISVLRNSQNIFNLVKMLAGRTGTRLDYTKLSSLTGISRPTLYNYLYLLEQSFLITLVPVIAKNPDKEIVKAKKIFFNDNGILNVLSDISSGAKFENSVFNQLRHLGEINYYALKSGKEIDFILNKGFAFEVKETPSENDVKYLKNLSRQIKISKSRVIGRHPSPNFDDFIWGGDIR
jgi:predicted AAA+ superfamily ATPase